MNNKNKIKEFNFLINPRQDRTHQWKDFMVVSHAPKSFSPLTLNFVIPHNKDFHPRRTPPPLPPLTPPSNPSNHPKNPTKCMRDQASASEELYHPLHSHHICLLPYFEYQEKRVGAIKSSFSPPPSSPLPQIPLNQHSWPKIKLEVN